MKTSDKIGIALTVIVLWCAITNTIQRYSNPKLTETELLLLIPKNAVLIFE